MENTGIKLTEKEALYMVFVRRMCGLIVMPFLYMRYSFVLFLPILFIDGIPSEVFLVMWGIYAQLFGFIMGNCGVMKYWTKLFKWIFRVKFNIKGQWTSNMLHSYSVWSHPILKVREKEYKLSIAVMGGNLYDEEDNLRRKAIVYWLLG